MLLALFVALTSMQTAEWHELKTLQFWDLSNRKMNLENYVGTKCIAFVFLSPECPLSQNYTNQLNELDSIFPDGDLAIFAVFPGRNYGRKNIVEFKEKYSLNCTVVLDKKFELARYLGASITPQVFLFSSKNDAVVYSGAIDNWAIKLGKQRKHITKKYLLDAINCTLLGCEIDPSITHAIGCFLEIK